MIRSLFVVLSILLTGCSTNKLPKADLTSEMLVNKGMVYFSTESVQKCTVHNVYMKIKETSKRYNEKNTFFVTNKYIEKDYPEVRGILHVATLPAGVYQLSFEQRHPFIIAEYKKVIPKVTVEKGKIKYLGAIEVNGCLNIAVTINDKYKRDTAKFRATYPKVTGIASSNETKMAIKK